MRRGHICLMLNPFFRLFAVLSDILCLVWMSVLFWEPSVCTVVGKKRHVCFRDFTAGPGCC